MKNWSSIKISLFALFCVVINCAGKFIAQKFNLPLWMDAYGTVLMAYAAGPLCGAVVGITTNLAFGFYDVMSSYYAPVSMVIGIIAGVAARRRWMDSFFGAISSSVLITFASGIISSWLNWLFWEGETGNVWGDGVIHFLDEQNFNHIMGSVLGEFYVDFLDKVILMAVFYGLLRFWRKRRKEAKERIAGRLDEGNNIILTLILSGLLAALPALQGLAASEDTLPDFDSYVQTVYNAENGLPCGEANDIAQTKDGIIWFGTYAGLYRYNGSDFRLMQDFESVHNVNCLYTDNEGRLWIGTNDNGISICINEKISNVLDEEEGLASGSVRSIVQGADGLYYIGTSGSLQTVTLNGGLMVKKEIPEVKYASSMNADERGFVAAVTASGELFILKDEEVIDSFFKEDDPCTFARFGADGSLYVGTAGDRILRYSISPGESRSCLKQTGTIRCEGFSYINNIYEYGKGFFVCADNGIGYWDGRSFVRINSNGFDNSIDHMLMDYQQNFWFTSSRLGLMRMSLSVFSNMYVAAGLEGKVVNATEKWNGQYYVGTDKGLDIIDGSGKKYIRNELCEELDGVRIRCIKKDRDGNLWICTYGRGLMEVHTGGSFHYYNSSEGTFGDWTRVVLELSDRTIAAAGDTGVSFLKNGKIVKTLRYGDGLVNAMILCLFEREDGILFAGSDGDGIAVIENGEVVKVISRADGLSSGVILRIVGDTEGKGVFIVTSNGLCYMDEEYNIRKLDKFPYYNNYDITFFEDGRVFVLGSAGIYVTTRDELLANKKSTRPELLDSKKGLTSSLTANAWNYRDDDGCLFLSTDSGVLKLNMSEYLSVRRPYRMMVSSIKQDDVPYYIERGIDFNIDRDTTKIEIFPEVINYSIEDPQVSYQLVGVDPEPVVLRRSELGSIVYTNLPSGDYVFNLSVIDQSTGEIKEISSYNLTKEKEIQDNRFFHWYMIIVGVLAVAWLTWFLVRTQLQTTLEFQRKELEFSREQVRMGNETVLAIARAVDAKDVNTSQHSKRVSEYSVLIGEELGLGKEECENLRKAALLHDIGKIAVPDGVLNKPAPLNEKEYEIMKTHVTEGAKILADFTLVKNVVEGARYHHEKYDGTGYVEGLKGDDIPLYGRIIGIADAFDAMTANRVYRKKLDFSQVMDQLIKGRGTQFDPKLLDIFLKLIEEKKIDVDSLYRDDSVFGGKEE